MLDLVEADLSCLTLEWFDYSEVVLKNCKMIDPDLSFSKVAVSQISKHDVSFKLMVQLMKQIKQRQEQFGTERVGPGSAFTTREISQLGFKKDNKQSK